MKIIFLARYLPAEGSTTHMYTLAEGLVEKGHNVTIISAGPKNEEKAVKLFEYSKEKIQHKLVSFPLKPQFGKMGKINQLLQYILATPKVLYEIKKINPDVIHCHYPVTSYLAKIYGKLTGVKFVTTHHITKIPNHPLHQKADAVIAISSELEEELLTKYSKNQIYKIYNGVDEDRFFSIKKRANEKIQIGFVGSLNKRKGLDVLLKACSLLVPQYKHEIVIVGDGDNEWVKSLIIENKLQNVTFLPFQDPKYIYETFDIFVLPSRQEGFGLVTIEAMMSKCAVVRSNTEGAYDQIDNYKSGIIFENENSQELYKALEKLINDKDLRDRIAEEGQKKALKLFTTNEMVSKTEELYKKIKG